MAIKILNVGFFAKQDPKTPMYVALASLIINVILNWFLAFQLGLGHVGLAIGSVIAAIISFFVLLIFLIKRSILILENKSIIFLIKILFSSLCLLAALISFQSIYPNWVDTNLTMQLIYLVLNIGIGSIIYFGLMFVLGLRISFFKN